MSTLFGSGRELDNSAFSLDSSNENYRLNITGNTEVDFKGRFNFEASIVRNSKGVSFSILKLKLISEESEFNHSIEFFVSREQTTELMPVGIYKVIENQEGFLSYFDGVFGFANMNRLGELPLFAKSGEIQINYLDNTILKGTLLISMRNSIGKSIEVSENFLVKN